MSKKRKKALCYTVGVEALYEGYFSTIVNPQKAIGGAVWRTLEDVQTYLSQSSATDTLKVYGVLADFERDAMPNGQGGYAKLLIHAPLVRVDEQGRIIH